MNVAQSLVSKWSAQHIELEQALKKATPPTLCKLRKSPNYCSPYAYCSLDKAVDARVQNEKFAW